MPLKRLKRDGLKTFSVLVNRYEVVRPAKASIGKTVSFLQTNTSTQSLKHLIAIPNFKYTTKKFICDRCQARFRSSSLLSNHSNSCGQNKFIPQKYLNPALSFEHKLSNFTDIPLHKDNAYIYISIEKHQNAYQAHIFGHKLDIQHEIIVSACLQTLASKTIIYVNQISTKNKQIRLEKNLKLLADIFLYQKLNCDQTTEIQFILSKIKAYISHIQIFLTAFQSDQILISQFLKSLLTVNLQTSSIASTKVKCSKANLSEVILTGKDTGLHYISTSHALMGYWPCASKSHEQNFAAFSQILVNLELHLGIDYKTGFISTLTYASRLFYDREIISSLALIFMSEFLIF